MNVVQREKRVINKTQSKNRNEFVRRDASLGIRGATSLIPMSSYHSHIRAMNKGPRYQFNGDDTHTLKRSMGPPVGLPRNAKRRIITNSTSTKPESSSSGKMRIGVLASDSAMMGDTSNDFCTPRNRPTALRYISSSSRGGYSNNRSAKSTSTSAIEASVILAISEGRGMARGEIGIAAIDLRHPHLVLCQFSDTLLYTHTLTKVNYFNPIEIIIPHTFCEGVQPNQLYKLIKDQFPLVNLTTVQRRHFNDAAGRQNIQTLCAPQYKAVCLQVFQKFYALTAAAAVLKYVEYIQCIVFARESLKIEYHSSENTMIIDVATACQLELVQPLVPSAGPTCCLLGVLSPTYTIGGIRALRAAILQPSCNKDFIEARLDSIQDLIQNDSGLMVDLQDILKKLSDIDKILLLCVESSNQNADKLGEAQLNQLLLLKTTMDIVPKLVEALNTAESGKLRAIKLDFENTSYNEIAERIKKIIQEDAHMEKGAMGSLQRCFAVKPDINGLLDVARRTYSELVEDIQKIVEQLSETYDLPIRLNQNVMKGFHIILPIASKNRRHFCIEDLPSIFIQVQNSGASVSMTTEELVVLDHQAKESLTEIQKLSNIVINALLKELRPFMSSLYKLCENVAELDILLALAQASSIGSYIRPEFNSYLDIRNSVHPLLDYNSQVLPVPNDIFATPEYNFTIITGPNMGGKSIYIKQVAIIQVMAQIGCFLPATNAVLRLCDRLFSRIGFNDSVELNASTFVLEMKEVQHILKGLTATSLIIIDELCRGTSSEEGASIAWAICEELILSDAFVFFTTHFMYLTRLQNLYHNVVNRHTSVTEEFVNDAESQQKRLVYHHKIEPGITNIEHYGLSLAAKTNLPENTIKLALELAELIVKNKTPNKATTPEKNDECKIYHLNANIKLESRKIHAEDRTHQLINKFKHDNPELIIKLKNQKNKFNSSFNSNIGYSNRMDHNEHHEPSNNIVSKITYINQESTTAPTSGEDLNKLTNSHKINTNYNSVKSSNELLHTVINTENDLANTPEPNELADNSTHYHLTNFDVPEIIENTSSDSRNSFNVQNIETTSFNNFSEDNKNGTISKEEAIAIENPSSNNDLADVVTQIIDKDSMYDTSISFQNSNQTISLDRDFMMETINEINQEFNIDVECLENLVLTPPMEFRD